MWKKKHTDKKPVQLDERESGVYSCSILNPARRFMRLGNKSDPKE